MRSCRAPCAAQSRRRSARCGRPWSASQRAPAARRPPRRSARSSRNGLQSPSSALHVPPATSPTGPIFACTPARSSTSTSGAGTRVARRIAPKARCARVELALRKTDVQPARLPQRDVDAGDSRSPRRSAATRARNAASTRRTTACRALALDPDEAEVAARRAIGDVAFVQQARARCRGRASRTRGPRRRGRRRRRRRRMPGSSSRIRAAREAQDRGYLHPRNR